MRKNFRLKVARMEKGLTQKEMADAIGMPYTTYIQKENGLYDFRELEIIKVCEVLGKNITDLFFTE